jgi:hypothetical protein
MAAAIMHTGAQQPGTTYGSQQHPQYYQQQYQQQQQYLQQQQQQQPPVSAYGHAGYRPTQQQQHQQQQQPQYYHSQQSYHAPPPRYALTEAQVVLIEALVLVLTGRPLNAEQRRSFPTSVLRSLAAYAALSSMDVPPKPAPSFTVDHAWSLHSEHSRGRHDTVAAAWDSVFANRILATRLTPATKWTARTLFARFLCVTAVEGQGPMKKDYVSVQRAVQRAAHRIAQSPPPQHTDAPPPAAAAAAEPGAPGDTDSPQQQQHRLWETQAVAPATAVGAVVNHRDDGDSGADLSSGGALIDGGGGFDAVASPTTRRMRTSFPAPPPDDYSVYVCMKECAALASSLLAVDLYNDVSAESMARGRDEQAVYCHRLVLSVLGHGLRVVTPLDVLDSIFYTAAAKTVLRTYPGLVQLQTECLRECEFWQSNPDFGVPPAAALAAFLLVSAFERLVPSDDRPTLELLEYLKNLCRETCRSEVHKKCLSLPSDTK